MLDPQGADCWVTSLLWVVLCWLGVPSESSGKGEAELNTPRVIQALRA